ncbi:DNA-binding MarR family transcriptional regulator [Methanococcus voltae]|uniref:DNA-binding MarR family transcriptional regulator n=1 Tax=Methanococcus voltae TaxID=2188 RepID=A0A8J7S0R9_METVO|nr:MarR family transcriptional regulator [Methanococcus voltae]MBP2201290.1 DNA-binding MarR family transcriptional regulator [Methanococcus voltae]
MIEDFGIFLHMLMGRQIEISKKNFPNIEEEYSKLTIIQLDYLYAIHTLNSPSFSDIAKHMNVANSSVTEMYHRLYKKGYVCKSQSEKDKREYQIHLTFKGNKLIYKDLMASICLSKEIFEKAPHDKLLGVYELLKEYLYTIKSEEIEQYFVKYSEYKDIENNYLD